MKTSVKAIVFDWGDTVMRDYKLPGPMHAWNMVSWIPGAELVIKNLSKNYCCIIATSADHSDTQDMKKALKMVGADQYFTYFYSQKELGVKKPDPIFFKRSAELSGFNPEDCMMVGNLYSKDIVGAKEAGMKTVLFNEFSEPGPFPLADSVITHMDELILLFDVQTT